MIPEIFSLMDRGWVFQIIPKNNYAINDNNIRFVATASAALCRWLLHDGGRLPMEQKMQMIASCKP